MSPEAVTDPPSTNGHGDPGEAERAVRSARSPAALAGGLGSIAAGVLTRASGALRAVVPSADLDDRDADYIREKLPLAWIVSTLWFRGEVRNLGNVPERGPVLLVGNHSGGVMTPDTMVFTLAFNTYFGVERRFHTLAHNLLFLTPWGAVARRFGVVPASQANAAEVLEADGAVLVYPGGDWETHRPSWERHTVDFHGRTGFIELALREGVPIVPVVAIGGQETALFLTRGATLARLLGLRRLARTTVLPINLSLPFGLNVGDAFGHIPLPAKITIEVLPKIDLREEFGPDPDIGEVHDHLHAQMQDALSALATERRFPVIG